jgi:hypothetical protein
LHEIRIDHVTTIKEIEMSTPSITEARAQLANAEAAERAERHQKLVSQLAAVREELRVKGAELEQMQQKILQSQADDENVYHSILVVLDAIGTSSANRPAVADYLAADPEVVAWQQKHDALVAEHARLLSERRALYPVELLRSEGLQLRDRVQSLIYAEQNLLNALDGSVGRGFVGGVVAPGT